MTDRALFVRLPAEQADKLDRASFALKIAKKDLVTELVERHLEPPMVEPGQTTVGRHAFRPAQEVLTLPELAELLRLDEEATRALAEAGELPGRRIGEEWRFSRDAVIAWLSAG
jgi:excisionase family DNA binding protein